MERNLFVMSKPKLIIKRPNENGKIELSQEELTTLIDDAYEEGYADGYLEKRSVTPQKDKRLIEYTILHDDGK